MATTGRLVSRLAMVTGGGSGIGRAVCRRLASEGASVVVADVCEASANETLRSLPGDLRGQAHMAAAADVASKESVDNLLTSIQARYFQPPSVCVNAAGVTQDNFLLDMEDDDFDRVVRVNLKVGPPPDAVPSPASDSSSSSSSSSLQGSFLVIRAVARALVASGAPKGSIVTVGSIVGKVGNMGQVNYAASKAGVEGLTRTAAKELSRFGIRCNCVLPGFISTPMTDKVTEKVIGKKSPTFAPSSPQTTPATSREPAWKSQVDFSWDEPEIC
ncbi:estradiol 17-beta-dehydrogenase 8 isoform X2 [Syngnathoides biaculeatus]|uniref:estradiol 17-beta-dehydrogenase 8 isoform X2 n=1 Tax=Syngnathoides biaculeatus TaxID=300417 RepID=UPI002ADE9526|nr:estradiol 17-beta-dehydrogenase 8 isoform X2 [Syngnathoides biaculeatus]